MKKKGKDAVFCPRLSHVTNPSLFNLVSLNPMRTTIKEKSHRYLHLTGRPQSQGFSPLVAPPSPKTKISRSADWASNSVLSPCLSGPIVSERIPLSLPTHPALVLGNTESRRTRAPVWRSDGTICDVHTSEICSNCPVTWPGRSRGSVALADLCRSWGEEVSFGHGPSAPSTTLLQWVHRHQVTRGWGVCPWTGLHEMFRKRWCW